MIYLASKSPRRKQLLEQAEITFNILVEDTDEYIDPTLHVIEVPMHIAIEKAKAILPKVLPTDIIIAADTIVCIDNEIIGKPNSQEHAIEILEKLNGRMHKVITGVCLLQNKKMYTFSDITHVYFNTLTTKNMMHYITTYKPYDKAGAYAIQEWIGAVGIQKIEGCFYNVMGLPIAKVVQALKKEFDVDYE
jgi:septum formation protein